MLQIRITLQASDPKQSLRTFASYDPDPDLVFPVGDGCPEFHPDQPRRTVRAVPLQILKLRRADTFLSRIQRARNEGYARGFPEGNLFT
jgi:hypothetical protein